MNMKSGGATSFGADVRGPHSMKLRTVTRNIFKFECRGADGKLKWVDGFENLTTTEGRNEALTQFLKGSSYTAAFYVGLVDNASFTALAVGDTAAEINGTNQWIELTAYSGATRPALTLGSASSGSIDNSGSPAVYAINATKTINGGFVVTTNTKAGTTGKIYGEGSFSSPRALVSGDTLTVTVTLTLASA